MRRTRFSTPELVTVVTSPTWVLCESLIKAFEDAWRQGEAPAIADYLRAEGTERRALLVELVHVELEFRLKAGEPARVDSYLASYPELGNDRRATLELLAAEFDLRRRHQRDANPDEYRDRFPHLADDLLSRLSGSAEQEPRTSATADPGTWPAVPGYEIVAEIGRGGMGVVYQARELHLGRHVALKFLPAEYARDPERLGRFLYEARTASALNHPHICTVHALSEYEGRPFIVMEFIEGLTMQALSARRPRPAEVARLIAQAALALTAAHAAGVVHRDIKPENIMVRADGWVKVLDFGLARRLPTLAGHDAAAGPDTDLGIVLGTVAYMSPEQARGEPVDRASDLFSLGIVLYQLTTGRHPFETTSALGTMHAIATREPVAPSALNPEVPAALSGLIEAMLRKDARLRPTAAEVETALVTAASQEAARSVAAPPPRPIVPREPELAALRATFAAAEAGQGSMVCVAGEPGIGKTVLIEDLFRELAASGRSCLLARGRCSERLAGTEAYLPILEALADLMRGEAGGAVAYLMQVVAPTWFDQLAPLAGPGDLSSTRAPTPTSLSERASSQQAMLREFGNLLQEVSRRGTVVLFLDDVHWADVSTVDLLAHLGRHCPTLRLLVLITYRPTELFLGPHPFHRVKLDLQGKGVCKELTLGFLTRQHLDRYLTLAFPDHALPADFVDLVYARTEGSPLFMVDLLHYLRERGVIAESEGRWSLTGDVPDLRRQLPESVRGMVERKLEPLDQADRRLLTAAAVLGNEFDSAAVAGTLARDPADVEERLQVLARVHGLVRFVREDEFADRTLTLRYAFVHVLYQQALEDSLAPSRRASLSAALARALELHHGEQSPAIAATLGCLYESARDSSRAASYFLLAARNAARVFAHRDAISLAQRGLRLLATLPDSSVRASLELPLQTTLGLQLQVTEGYAAAAAYRAYTRARELCPPVADSASHFAVLWGLWLFHKVRSELARAQDLADELLGLARRLTNPGLALQAHQALGMTAFCRGEPAAAIRHVEQTAALYDPDSHHTHAFQFGQDPGVICKAYGAVALWLMGYPDAAERQSQAAIRMSQELSPSTQAVALHFAAMLHQLCRNASLARVHAEATVALAAEHGFSFWLAGGTVLSGWALCAEGDATEGLARLRRGLRDWLETGSITYETYYLGLLAETLGNQGEFEEGLRVLDAALNLAQQTGEGLCEAELFRLRGELLLRGPQPTSALVQQAEAAFVKALEIASRQEAKALELRAAMSLVRHCPDHAQARPRLASIYDWFTQGLQTLDLQEARKLLEPRMSSSGLAIDLES